LIRSISEVEEGKKEKEREKEILASKLILRGKEKKEKAAISRFPLLN